MTITGTYIYSPRKEDLTDNDTGWLPKSIDMLTLVDEWDECIANGQEDNWWGSLHTDTHPDTCIECIDVNIYTSDDSSRPRLVLYPIAYNHNEWKVDTSQWFDITSYFYSTICGECGEYKPDDDRVYGGMKCGECAYS